MPHFHSNNEDADSEAGNSSNPRASAGADLLLSLASTASEQALSPPVASAPYQFRLPPQPDSSVDPSPPFPQGANQPWMNHPMAPSYPPLQQAEGEAAMMMSFRGGQQLCPSPIKAQANTGKARSPAEEAEYAQVSHPSHAMWMASSAGPRYGKSVYQPPVPGSNYSHLQQQDLSEEVSATNRSVPANPDHKAAHESHSESVDRSFDSQDSERLRPLSKSELPQQKAAKNINGQRVISPASSNEGPATDKDDSTDRQHEKQFDPRVHAHAHHPPYHHAGYMHPGAYAHPGGYGYPPYGYPTAPYQPYFMMHAPPHGSMYPMHPPVPMMHQALKQAQQPEQPDEDEDTAPDTQKEVPRNPSPHPSVQSVGTQREVLLDSSAHHSIQSVADWQQATLASGKVPSTNRCVALKPPVPSRFWGKSDKTHDVKLPDFHLLVNYPDYITKGRSTVDKAGNAAPEGQKHCVMCGKLRLCSSSASVAGRASRAAAAVGDGDDFNAMEIIPRQNKGVCTACDITVWVIITVGPEKLEIKWCKGCKNFRTWAAFGEKGLATKCVRCRDRQKEKYLWQKETHRQSKTFREEKKEDDELAARGLKGLMQAADA